MSREIKFRAIIQAEGFLEVRYSDEFFTLSKFFSVFEDHARFDEYTGLKDRNGKEIYEGDFIDVQFMNRGEPYFERFTVVYEQKNARFTLVDVNDGKWSFTSDNVLEVIGNIYETKEETK